MVTGGITLVEDSNKGPQVVDAHWATELKWRDLCTILRTTSLNYSVIIHVHRIGLAYQRPSSEHSTAYCKPDTRRLILNIMSNRSLQFILSVLLEVSR